MNNYCVAITLEDGSRVIYHVLAECEREAEDIALKKAKKEHGEVYL